MVAIFFSPVGSVAQYSAYPLYGAFVQNDFHNLYVFENLNFQTSILRNYKNVFFENVKKSIQNVVSKHCRYVEVYIIAANQAIPTQLEVIKKF